MWRESFTANPKVPFGALKSRYGDRMEDYITRDPIDDMDRKAFDPEVSDRIKKRLQKDYNQERLINFVFLSVAFGVTVFAIFYLFQKI